MIVLVISVLFLCIIVIVERLRSRMNTEDMLDAAEQKRQADLRAGVWP